MLTIILTLTFLFSGNFVIAGEQEDIEYLLTFIAESNCIFIRNGKEHQAKEASEHLAMKYNHVKRRIKTARDFIEKIASKSSLTRRAYKIRCEGKQQVPAQQWLKEALETHRITVSLSESQ